MEEVTLKEYVDKGLEAIEKATSLVAANMEKRFDSVNEFRGQLKDQANNLATKVEVEQKFVRVDDRFKLIDKTITELQLSKAILEGKASQKTVTITMIISIIGSLMGFIGIILSIIKTFAP
jgi:hypothetical protein